MHSPEDKDSCCRGLKGKGPCPSPRRSLEGPSSQVERPRSRPQAVGRRSSPCYVAGPVGRWLAVDFGMVFAVAVWGGGCLCYSLYCAVLRCGPRWAEVGCGFRHGFAVAVWGEWRLCYSLYCAMLRCGPRWAVVGCGFWNGFCSGSVGRRVFVLFALLRCAGWRLGFVLLCAVFATYHRRASIRVSTAEAAGIHRLFTPMNPLPKKGNQH